MDRTPDPSARFLRGSARRADASHGASRVTRAFQILLSGAYAALGIFTLAIIPVYHFRIFGLQPGLFDNLPAIVLSLPWAYLLPHMIERPDALPVFAFGTVAIGVNTVIVWLLAGVLARLVGRIVRRATGNKPDGRGSG
ncbi:hypothetical protein [Ensifer soli]|uniref:hypothetical protein n=1 Tax=Ciceribacter sp. sgz301302 TaxID=3342379 RepID=UPI0035BB414B